MNSLSKQFEINFNQSKIDKAILEAKNRSIAMRTPQFLKLAFSCIDLTTLNATDNEYNVENFTEKVASFNAHYPQMPNVAAICVYPNMVKTVRENLNLNDVNIASVSAGFPSSMTFDEVKTLETKMAVAAGASEIDIVIPIGEFLAGNLQFVADNIAQQKAACGDAHLKVILETGALKTPENIWKAAMLAMESGADFIKTSTGKIEPAATPEAVFVMCLAIREFEARTGKKIGLKPAGGIVETKDALHYLAIVETALGENWLNNKMFRIGASRLANNLLTDIEQKIVSYF